MVGVGVGAGTRDGVGRCRFGVGGCVSRERCVADRAGVDFAAFAEVALVGEPVAVAVALVGVVDGVVVAVAGGVVVDELDAVVGDVVVDVVVDPVVDPVVVGDVLVDEVVLVDPVVELGPVVGDVVVGAVVVGGELDAVVAARSAALADTLARDGSASSSCDARLVAITATMAMIAIAPAPTPMPSMRVERRGGSVDI